MAEGTWGGTLDTKPFRVTIEMLINQQKVQTGFHLRDLAVQDNSCEDVAGEVVDWVMNNFRTQMTVADAMVAVDVTKLGTEEGFTHSFVNTFGSANVGNSFTMPTFLTCKVALKRQARKRYGQGRMYWPVRAEQLVDGDVLNATGVAQYQGVIDALLAKFSGSVLTHDLSLINLHGILAPRPANGTTPARPQIPAKWYDVEAVILSTALTTLSSRKIGHGS